MRPSLPLTLTTLLTSLAVVTAPEPLAGQRFRSGDVAPVNRLAAPTGLFVSWSNGSAVLAWQPVAGAAAYLVNHATSPTGPWTRLTRMPITATVYAHATTAPPGTLLYYQVMGATSDMVATGAEGIPALVGFIRPAPQAPRGVGVRQVGNQAVLSWYPVPGASGYRIKSPDPRTASDIRVGARTRTASAPLPYWNSPQAFVLFAEFEPGIEASAQTPSLLTGDPAICWPATRQVGAGPSFIKVAVYQTEVKLDFEPVSGTAAYLVERVLEGNQANAAAWEPLACLSTSYSSGIRAFGDRTYSLQPGQRYVYRITAFTADGRAGWQVSPPVDIPVMPHPASVTVTPAGGAVDVTWPATFGSINYLLETSYGYWELVPAGASPMVKRLWGVPPGTHTFQVSSLYPGNTPAPGSATRSSPLTVP